MSEDRMALTLRRAGERFVTRQNGWEGRYCFSYGEHYDPANVGFGPLVACNDFSLEPGGGFDPHEHRAVEIVTWVAAGALSHDGGDPLAPGQVQVISAADGITHAETNPSADQAARFIQVWLVTDAPGGRPTYAMADVTETVEGRLAPVVGEGAPLTVRTPATLYAGRLTKGSQHPLPGAERVHLFVVRGEVRLLDVLLEEGDEVRLVGEQLTLTAATEAEVLIWALP
jgi:redox-sensitive bicupin YhaK (pirin superfamily)